MKKAIAWIKIGKKKITVRTYTFDLGLTFAEIRDLAKKRLKANEYYYEGIDVLSIKVL